MLSDDTISLRHLPRRSSKNCDLQFANNDRFKANYSIDDNVEAYQGCYTKEQRDEQRNYERFESGKHRIENKARGTLSGCVKEIR